MINISSITVYREGRFPTDAKTLLKPVSNISLEISVNASQCLYTIPCKSRVKVLNNIFLSQEFCNDFSPEAKLETCYSYNIVLLPKFYSNHSLLDNVNAALELDYTLKAVLPKLAVERSEFEAILASETESRLDFDVAINASEKQKKIYDNISTILWQKNLTMATANTKFNLLRGFDWAVVINIIITGVNSIFIGILCMRLKAIYMLLIGVKTVRADFIFSHPMTSTTTATPNLISAKIIWQTVKEA